MSETQKSIRRPWQIHLSTAIAMMLAAGGLLCANTLPGTVTRTSAGDVFASGYGWPLAYTVSRNSSAFEPDIEIDNRVREEAANPPATSKVIIFTFDAVIAMALLGALAWLSESVIRRREARET